MWIADRLRALGYFPDTYTTPTGNTRYLICPSTQTGGADRFTIGYNSHVVFGKWAPARKIGDVPRPTETWMWLDAETLAGDSRYVLQTWNDIGLINLYGYPSFRHLRSMNVAYLDGHVASMSETEYNNKVAAGTAGEQVFWYGQ
jgi:prepilin-type processing-associated H-X9-DG protein